MQEAHQAAVDALTLRIRAAIESNSALRITGGNSKEFYRSHGAGDSLSTAGLSGVVSYEPSELVVTAGAGTPVALLEAMLAEKNQCLPFEPPHFAWSGASRQATVGGMVAAGLSGPARGSVGGVRDYVLGLKLINGRAEHLTFGGQVMKNVAGYDVSRLMVGAMGSLGVITEVSLKVLPRAHAEATLVFATTQGAALEQLHRWGAQPLPLNASLWADGNLWVRLRGAVAAVESACQRMTRDLAGQRTDATQAQDLWHSARDQHHAFFAGGAQRGHVLWRISVPQTATVLDLAWPQLVEWHGGLRWLWAPAESGPQLARAARAAGGSAAAFVTLSAQRPDGIRQAEGSAHLITERLKVSFDPHGVFNPGLNLHAD